MYSIRFLKAADKELERLDKPLAKRIATRIHWLAENLDDTSLKALKGDLAGLYKLRKEKIIIIHSIGHRRDIYQKS